jgi:hypothetical protein
MLAFSRSDVTTDPYPHAVKTSVLDGELYQRLKSQFPKEDFFTSIAPVMGNRRRVASDEAGFYEFLNGAEAWREFFGYLNSEKFVHLAIDLFGDQIKPFGCVFDPNKPWKFDQNYHRNILADKKSRLKTEMRKLQDKVSKRPQELYVHLDVSSAHNGYTREIHTDNPNRLLAMVMYFSSAEETGGEGGQLALFRHRQQKPLSEYERFPKDEDTILLESVSPQDNKAAIFLNTKNSYHSVPLVKNAKAWRNFIYFGLTAKTDSLWR